MVAVTAIEPSKVDVPATRALMVDRTCAPDGIPAAMESGFSDLMDIVEKHAVELAGPPRAIYEAYGSEGVRFTLAVPVAAGARGDAGEARVGELPATKTLRFTHTGPYDDLIRTYAAITSWMVEHKYMKAESDWNRYMPMWEEYLNDPTTTPPDELVTYIHLPLTG
jgi:effector-binding domain-containing protein